MTPSSERPVFPSLVASLVLVPIGILCISEIFASLFNPALTAGYAGRLAAAAKPGVLGLALLLAGIYVVVVRIMLRPLFAHLDGVPGRFERARRATLGIPAVLLFGNLLFWSAGSVVFYALNGWRAPGGTPLVWTLTLKFTESLISSCFSALLVNIVLLEPKRLLGIDSLREGERDWFVENEDFFITLSALIALGVRFVFVARFFELRSPESGGPSSLTASYAAVGLVMALVTFTLLALSRKERNVQMRLLDERLRLFADGKGVDLTVTLELLNYDSVGRLAARFNGFAQALRTMISEVNETALTLESLRGRMEQGTAAVETTLSEIENSVRDIGEQARVEARDASDSAESVRAIDEGIQALHASVERQAAGVAESSAGVEEMLASIQTVAGSSERMESTYGSLLSASEEGTRRLEEAERTARDLEEKSRILNEANAVIAKIAANTNLLAMNAAIEAAHAGEAGAGFSVVANEVRTLAETSAVQSKEVGRALAAMRASADAISSAVSSAREGFAAVRALIAEVSRVQEEVQASLSEQTEGGRLIRESLAFMNGMTGDVRQEASKMTQEGRAVTERMSRLLETADRGKAETERIHRDAAAIRESFGAVTELLRGNTAAIARLGGLAGRFKV